MRRGNLGERVTHWKVYGHSSVSCAETAELIDLPFYLWTRMGRRKHKFSHIDQMAPMYTSSVIFANWCQCAHVGGTLAPPGEYDWTVCLWQRCGLMSNYFDHLLQYAVDSLFFIYSIGYRNMLMCTIAIWWAIVMTCHLCQKCTADRPNHMPTIFAGGWILWGLWCLNTKAHSYILTVYAQFYVHHWLTIGVVIFCIQNVKLKFKLILSLGVC